MTAGREGGFERGDLVKIYWTGRLPPINTNGDLIPDSYKNVSGWDLPYGKIATVLTTGSGHVGYRVEGYRLELEPGVEISFASHWLELASPLEQLAKAVDC